MKYLTMMVAAAAAIVTALSMAMEPQFKTYSLFTIGFVNVNPFDVVIGGAILLLLARNALHLSPDPVMSNRYVLWLCAAYVCYQLFVVLPIAVVGHGLRPIDVVRQQEVRLFIILVPFFYSMVLRYWRPEVVIALFDAAAAGLALWVLYKYKTTGGAGYWDGDVYRLRAAWGGTTLLFGWLVFTSLFFWPTRLWRLAPAVLGGGALLLVNHRSGIIALLLGLIVQLVAMRGVAKRAAIAFAVFAVLGVGVLLSSAYVRHSIAYSLGTLFNPRADPNAGDRVTRSLLGLAYFQHHLFGDYIWNQAYYLVNLGKEGFEPHNFAVQLLVTQGVVATGLYLAPVTVVFVLAWRNRAERQSSVMLAYLSFYMMFCLLNTNIDSIENVALLYVPMALVLDVNRRLCLARESARLEGRQGVNGQGESAAADILPERFHPVRRQSGMSPAAPRLRGHSAQGRLTF